MNKAFAFGIVMSFCANHAYAALNVGDRAPDFTAPASLAGKQFEFDLKTARAKGPVVIYFYPSAYTGGCNLQAHTFAENVGKFEAAGATILGVSLDKIDTLHQFSADPQYCAGKLAVASDANGAIAKSYNIQVREAQVGKLDSRGVAIDHGLAERVTYVVKQDGTVEATISGFAPVENVQKALDTVQSLTKKNH